MSATVRSTATAIQNVTGSYLEGSKEGYSEGNWKDNSEGYVDSYNGLF